jgi:tRNA(fMet)-specific endonuclease VapC
MTYVLDTNMITAILKGNDKVKARVQGVLLNGEDILINGISYYEIKRGLLATSAVSQLRRFESMCKGFGLLLLDTQSVFDEAAKTYAYLQKKGQLIEDADILISSAATTRGYTLVSDDSHFGRIHDLKTENWLN